MARWLERPEAVYDLLRGEISELLSDESHATDSATIARLH